MNEQPTNVVLTADTSQYQQEMGTAEAATSGVLNSVVKLSTALAELNRRAGHRIEMVGAGTAAGLAGATAMAARFQNQMSQLEAQAMMTNRSFERTTKTTNALRTDIAATTSEIISMVTQLNKLGQGGQNVQKMSDTFFKLGAVTGESIPALVDGLISLQRQMGTTGTQQTLKYASSLATLSANAGTSATGILEFANAIAPVGRVAGMTQTEVMGVATAFTKAGADGYSAANAFNKMLTDITRSIQYGSPELASYANLIGKSTEEFSKMSKTEAVTQIFEEINKQGPDAIKTLERFGLDGIRYYRALQAVASSGGIRQSVTDAIGGYEDTTKFTNAAKEAMNGLSEAGQQLRNVLAQIGEAFGKGLLTPLTYVTNAITAVLSPIAKLMQHLNNLPGLFTAVGAAATMGLGLAVTHIGKLLGVAGLAQIGMGFPGRGFMAGYRANDVANMSKHNANAFESYQAGMGGRLQRGGYRFGNRMGIAAGWIADEMRGGPRPGDLPGAPTRPGPGGIRGMFRRGINATTSLVSDMVVGTTAPITPGAQRDVFSRRPAFSAVREREYQSLQRSVMAGARGMGIGGDPGQMEALRKNMDAFRESTKEVANNAREQRAQTGVIRHFGQELRRMGGGVGQGYAGLGMAGARLAGRGIRAAGSSLMGFLGGPWGVGLVGGMGAMALKGHLDDRKEKFHEATIGGDAAESMGGSYRTALGEAARATMTFAEVVQRSANKISGEDFKGKITPDMARDYESVKHTAKYTHEGMADMSETQLVAHLKTAGLTTPQSQKLAAMDVLKFTGGNVQRAQAILDAAKSDSPIDLRDIYKGIGEVGFWGGATDKANQLSAGATSVHRSMLADLANREDSTQNIARLNTATIATVFAETPDQGKRAEILADRFGVTDEDQKKELEEILAPGRFMTAMPDEVYARAVRKIQEGSTSPFLREWVNAYRDSGLTGNDMWSTEFQMPSAQDAGPYATLSKGVLSRARETSLGGILEGENTALERALSDTGSPEALARGVDELVTQTMALKGGFVGAIAGLQEFKGAAKDASDPLYQLAHAAEAEVRRRQSFEMSFMTQPQQMDQLLQNYRTSRMTALATPDAQGVQEQLAADRAAYEQGQLGAFERVKSITMQHRSLETQLRYGEEDYTQSREYATKDKEIAEERSQIQFDIGRARAEEQFGISQARAQEQYDINRERSLYSFNLTRERQEEDYYRQRERNDEAYNRQLKRQNRDYTRSRTYAYADFNKNRLRQEADFNHQVEMMARQTAKNIYNIYERVNVQRTWDAANLMSNVTDQNQRLAEQQANLDKLRGLGVSSDVIKTLALGESQNAQQLARLVDDLMSDPALVKQFNQGIATRMKEATKAVTDEDNEAWVEMQRSFKQNVDRSLEDFSEQMQRQAVAFATSLADQRAERTIMLEQQTADFKRIRKQQSIDFNRSMNEAAADFKRGMDQAAADFKRQADQQAADFDRNLKWQQESFKLAMDRQEKAYKIQIKRSYEMFNEAATDMTDSILDMSKDALKALHGSARSQFDALVQEIKIGKARVNLEIAGLNPIMSPWVKIMQTTLDAVSGQYGTGGSRVTNAGAPITSNFGKRGNGFHYGVDLGVPIGSPVYAYKSGKVLEANYQPGGFGYNVRLDHGGGLYTIYGHLSKFAVREGQQVSQGQQIAASGNSGNSTGPHLHYEVRKGSAYGTQYAVNPMSYLRRSSGGGVFGRQIGDRVPMLAEAGEYVIPKFRAKELGWNFFDQLRANGLAGVKNALVASQSVPTNASSPQYFYSRVDKSTNFSGDITVQAQDPLEMMRKLDEKKRLRNLVGSRS